MDADFYFNPRPSAFIRVPFHLSNSDRRVIRKLRLLGQFAHLPGGEQNKR